MQQAELLAAEAAGIDALVAVYHSDHRELCAHERDWPFRIMNIYEIVGASMGLHHDDHFKRFKICRTPTRSWPIAAISCKSTASTSRPRGCNPGDAR